MSSRVALTKMHGAHNDFVIVDRRTANVGELASFARRVCDRRAGIGADGLIAIETSRSRDVAVRTINADGSEAEMCGNGVRCAARWLEEAGEGDRIAFETAAGNVETEVVARRPEYLVRVSMAAPRITSTQAAPDAFLVDLGNPHLVLFRDAVEEADLDVLAPQLQTNSAFERGVNVHVAAVDDAHRLHVRHWERGVGATPACGTGAVAAAASAIQSGRAKSPV
ncbi:MAG: diaminopimelate epimerase, partial [Candidatus Tumulicola sp.]